MGYRALFTGSSSSSCRVALAACAIWALTGLFQWAHAGEKCLYVGSYHRGNAWQDGIERGLRKVLAGRCEIRQFNMDTKRNPSPLFCRNRALEARELILSWKPDIVIVSDDNASKYLVVPHFRDAKIPFVFCGVNWTAKEYGYPFSNVTGMVEVLPVREMIRQVKEILPGAKTGICLMVDRLSERKSCDRHTRAFGSAGIEIFPRTADTLAEFEKAYAAAQDSDFIILVNNSVIRDWDDEKAGKIMVAHSRKLTVTFNRWMTSHAMLGLTHLPEEQGEYAGGVALKILEGTLPSHIPVVSNRRWNTYVNKPLLKRAGIRVPASILRQAEKVQ